jgi:hypothetical protein
MAVLEKTKMPFEDVLCEIAKIQFSDGSEGDKIK